jgi:speckle-type POZ protein
MQGMKDAWEQVKEMRGREEEAHQRAAFLAQGLAMAWKEVVHTDIVVKPGAGPPIRAHKAILVSKWAAYGLRTSGPSFPTCISNEA